MISKRQLLGLGAGSLAAGIGVWVAKNSDYSSLRPAPLWSLKLPMPSGGQLALASFRGRPLLINFWAPWCAPCVEEMPLLNHLYTQHAANGFQLLGIAADKSESVTQFLKRTPLQFPIALAGFEGVALSQSLGNASGGLPYSLLFDTKGAILFSKQGALTTNDISTIPKLLNLA